MSLNDQRSVDVGGQCELRAVEQINKTEFILGCDRSLKYFSRYEEKATYTVKSDILAISKGNLKGCLIILGYLKGGI